MVEDVASATVTERTAAWPARGYPCPSRGRTSMPSITVSGQWRAVAELEATIGRVEQQRREQLAAAARAAAAGRDPAPLRALLRLTEDYLACLRQSRRVLRWELPPAEPRP